MCVRARAEQGLCTDSSDRCLVKEDGTVVTKVVHVSAGLQFTVMLDVNGLVWTFGSNDHGQLCQVSYLLADAV